MTRVTARPPRRIRALVVDDEALARRRLIAMLADERDIDVVGEASGGSAAVQAIADMRPDLLFLDVQMPGLDGFGVLRCTVGAHRPAIVFVTAHDEYAIRAFEIHAVDYLLKPVGAARLHEAARRAVERLSGGPRSETDRKIGELLAEVAERAASRTRIPVRGSEGIDLIDVSDVIWIQADGDHLRLHASAAVHAVRETMTDLERKLQPFDFLRVHRSVMVNVRAVRAVEPIAKGDYHLVLRDGTRIRSGRRYRSSVQSLIR